MVSMTIRHVPDETRDRLAERAARAGQSLQEYLLATVVDAAARPEMAEVLAAHRRRLAASGSDVTTETILDSLAVDRR